MHPSPPVKSIQRIAAEGSCIVFIFLILTKTQFLSVLTKRKGRLPAIPLPGRIQDLAEKGAKPKWGKRKPIIRSTFLEKYMNMKKIRPRVGTGFTILLWIHHCLRTSLIYQKLAKLQVGRMDLP